MRKLISATAVALLMAAPAVAAGDVAKGEKVMKKCKACHMIKNGDEVLYKGGKTGPNLFGIVGRPAGSVEGFKYSKGMIAAGEGGLVWDEETLSAYLQDPTAYLKEVTGDDSAKSKMTLKLKKGMEDVIAFIASHDG